MPLFVANWKMYKTYDQAVAFAHTHCDELDLLSNSKTKIVIAPSFVCLDAVGKIFKNRSIALAAQDCAAHESGAYTGEVDAASLAQIGCAYAIIGHSERRQLCGETDELIKTKAEILLKNNITPIICIGETLEDFDKGHTLEVLEVQLANILPVLKNSKKEFCIAYEPIWAIGTGKVPALNELQKVFEWLSERIENANCTLLYGGSVDEKNASSLLKISHVGGLLIGGASCNFQSLKKIVS